MLFRSRPTAARGYRSSRAHLGWPDDEVGPATREAVRETTHSRRALRRLSGNVVVAGNERREKMKRGRRPPPLYGRGRLSASCRPSSSRPWLSSPLSLIPPFVWDSVRESGLRLQSVAAAWHAHPSSVLVAGLFRPQPRGPWFLETARAVSISSAKEIGRAHV